MKRAGVCLCMLVIASALLAAPSASAGPVCDIATPLPVVGGLLSSGLQTGLLDVGPVCSAASPTPSPSATTTPKPHSSGTHERTKTASTGDPAAVPTARPSVAPPLVGSRPTPRKPGPELPPSHSAFVQFATWITTPARVAFAAFCVAALFVAMWMGARVGRRRARYIADAAADAQLSAVMSVVPDAIVVTDDKNTIRALNAAATEILGASDDARGTLVARAIRGSERSGISFESWMRSSAPYASGTTGTLDNGLPVGLAATPVKAHGTVVGHVYLVRDLRKEHALDRMKEEFLSNISHELRTPLASALGFARLLQRRQLSATQQGAFVGAIVEACERLDRVVDLLIDVAALEGGTARTDAERVDIAELVRDVAARWADRAPTHVVTARAADGLKPIAAGVPLLRNAIEELMDNAIKFSPDGGIVTVSADYRLDASKPSIVISVADQGIGIDPVKREAVFDDFHQIDGSATRRFGGLGIGLAFVRRVTEAHGGRVEIVSEQGRGSTFSIVLPVTAPRAQAKGAAPKIGRVSRRQQRAQQAVRIEEARG